MLTVVALVVVVVIVRAARRLRSTGWAVALGLILGGALGNLADRMFRAPGVLPRPRRRLDQPVRPMTGISGRSSTWPTRPSSAVRSSAALTAVRGIDLDGGSEARARREPDSAAAGARRAGRGRGSTWRCLALFGFSRTAAAALIDAGDGQRRRRPTSAVCAAGRRRAARGPAARTPSAERHPRSRSTDWRCSTTTTTSSSSTSRSAWPRTRVPGGPGRRSCRAWPRWATASRRRARRAAGRRAPAGRRHDRRHGGGQERAGLLHAQAGVQGAHGRQAVRRARPGSSRSDERHHRRADRSAPIGGLQVRGRRRRPAERHPLRDRGGVPGSDAARHPPRDRAHPPDPGASWPPSGIRASAISPTARTRCWPLGSGCPGSGCTLASSASSTRRTGTWTVVRAPYPPDLQHALDVLRADQLRRGTGRKDA